MFFTPFLSLKMEPNKLETIDVRLVFQISPIYLYTVRCNSSKHVRPRYLATLALQPLHMQTFTIE